MAEAMLDSALDKARGALREARDTEVGSRSYERLLTIAMIQADIAQAEALERIARFFEEYAR